MPPRANLQQLQQTDDDLAVAGPTSAPAAARQDNQDVFRDALKIILQLYDKRQFVSQEESGDARTFLENYWITTGRLGLSRSMAAMCFSYVVSTDVHEALNPRRDAHEPLGAKKLSLKDIQVDKKSSELDDIQRLIKMSQSVVQNAHADRKRNSSRNSKGQPVI